MTTSQVLSQAHRSDVGMPHTPQGAESLVVLAIILVAFLAVYAARNKKAGAR